MSTFVDLPVWKARETGNEVAALAVLQRLWATEEYRERVKEAFEKAREPAPHLYLSHVPDTDVWLSYVLGLLAAQDRHGVDRHGATGELVNSHEVLGMLRRHYLPEGKIPGGIFVPEIEAPSALRRADLLWIPTTIAGGRGESIIGHEIKCQRVDVLRELADPAKADPWARYCSRWWLVVSDPALIDGLEVPAAWGIMAPPSGRRTRSMTIIREAPGLDPDPIDPALRKLVRWLGFHLYDADRANESLERRNELLEQRIQENGGRRELSREPEHLREILSKVHASGRQGWLDVDDDIVVAAIVDAARTQRVAAEVRMRTRGLLDGVKRILDPFGERVLKDLRELERSSDDVDVVGSLRG